MKTTILILLISAFAWGQKGAVNMHLGTDAKILFLGSDNQYTQHAPLGNFMLMGEAIDYNINAVATARYTYVNLSRKFNSVFVGYGYKIDLSDHFFCVIGLEVGGIQRERIPADQYDIRPDPVSLSGAGFTSIRYQVTPWLGFDLRPNVELATDIAGRLFRYQATTSIVIKILEP